MARRKGRKRVRDVGKRGHYVTDSLGR